MTRAETSGGINATAYEAIDSVSFRRLTEVIQEDMDLNEAEEYLYYHQEGRCLTIKNDRSLKSALMAMSGADLSCPLITVDKKKLLVLGMQFIIFN